MMTEPKESVKFLRSFAANFIPSALTKLSVALAWISVSKNSCSVQPRLLKGLF